MKTISDLMPGDILSNQDLGILFGCGNSGGMRRAKKTNSLIIISSHVVQISGESYRLKDKKRIGIQPQVEI
ncbi:hypothetical protein [Acinetobacter towneri]|uniref:hypothetical protein n=1 Tax=Acinetobacter towneri TaxID=202956 RepID=UPI003213E790